MFSGARCTSVRSEQDRDARYRERIVAQSLAHLPVVHPRELLPGNAAFHGRPPIVDVNEMPCPNCGAPVDADTGARCPVCNAPLADA